MKFGVREICDVVLKAKSAQKIGNKFFYKNEPVIYFDTLKTSTLEGAATTVYAQGGRGNSRLMAWEGERTLTFTMEDALISPEGFMILSGAGLIDASESETVKQHVTETIDVSSDKVTVTSTKGTDGVYTAFNLSINLDNIPYVPKDNTCVSADTWKSYLINQHKKNDSYIYVFLMKEGQLVSEPLVAMPTITEATGEGTETKTLALSNTITVNDSNNALTGYTVILADVKDFDAVMVDYYVERTSGAQEIEITPDKFGGNFYLEASTLFKNEKGVDMPAEFIIPNCKVQSNFTFTMASSGDPSTFTFTMDAFPDYTRFNRSKKVLAAIQIIEGKSEDENMWRDMTKHNPLHEDGDASNNV